MADHTVPRNAVGVHEVQLVPGIVDTVTFNEDLDRVAILNVSGSAIVYFTADGSTPQVKGAHCYSVLAALGANTVMPRTSGPTVVKLVSAGSPVVSVCRGDS
jgi:hypothetical protein